jgi:hypothetical protein
MEAVAGIGEYHDVHHVPIILCDLGGFVHVGRVDAGVLGAV